MNISLPSIDQLETTLLYQITIHWYLPVLSCIIYVLLVTVWSRYNLKNPPTQPLTLSYLFQFLVILHNLFLCLFSAAVFLFVFPEFIRGLSGPDWFNVLFAHESQFYQKVLGVWSWIFYLSKYYEIIDTLVLLLKGKPSSFLQSFHHTGAIIGMWALTVSRNPSVWIFVCFNSFIHTWMYLYFLLTCFVYYSPWKRFLTNLQITQFAVGNPLGLGLLLSGYTVDKEHAYDVLGQILGVRNLWSQYIALSANMVYVSCLIALFLDFSKKTYAGKKKEEELIKKKEE